MCEGSNIEITSAVDAMRDAWKRRGKLLLSRCDACGHMSFIPRSRCAECWSADLIAVDASGKGALVGVSSVLKGLPDLIKDEGPIFVAEIELEEEVTVIARILASAETGVPVGSAVCLVPEAQASQYELPTFYIV